MLVNIMPNTSIILEAEKRTEQRKYVDSIGIFGRPIKKLQKISEFIPIKRTVVRSDQKVFIHPDNISDMTYSTIDVYKWWNKIHFDQNKQPPGIRNAKFTWGKNFEAKDIWTVEIAMNNGTEFYFYYQDRFTLEECLNLLKVKSY